MEFVAFPKIARLSKECVVTEKVDGTNAQVFISFDCGAHAPMPIAMVLTEVGPMHLWAGSRTRLISPGKLTDNFGFAAWVVENAQDLVKLGPGRHFGEWYGKGIQRGYGLAERRFALFHAGSIAAKPNCVEVVPTLYTGEFDTAHIDEVLERMKRNGSTIAPGFKNPEGIIVFHTASRTLFKKTFDDAHKEAV